MPMRTLFLFISFLLPLYSCQKDNVSVPLPAAPIISPVAHLNEMVPMVEHRPFSSPAWNEARPQMPLQNRDELKTGEGGRAVVRFESGGSVLNVDEKSLIVIWDRTVEERKVHVVGLPEGEIKGRAEAEEELEIRTPAGWIKARNTEVKVSSKGLSKAFKVTVEKGEVEVFTAKKKSILKSGRSLKILQEKKEQPSTFMESIPIGSTLLKDSQFQVEVPSKKEFRTKSDSVIFSGIWEGDFTVWANGSLLNPDGEGKFKHTFKLVPGLNVITLQVSDPQRKNVEYFIYKITRETGP